MKLDKRQVQMIDQTLAIALMAFGQQRFTEKVGKEAVVAIREILPLIKESGEIPTGVLRLILSGFIIARDIADEQEYPTLTGFSWDESLDFILLLLKEI
jgi:hypothetical protein